MPIAVLCPGCKARFSVSEKYAGKKGPCPKCKAVITIPDVKVEDVKVHVPEEYAGTGKDTKGRAIGKPIPRVETKLPTSMVAAMVGGALVVLLIALVMRGASPSAKWPVVVLGLIALSPVLARAGYSFLRDDELEPYSGRALWIRTALCALAYVALWGVYGLVQRGFGLKGDTWEWLFLAAVFIPLGAAAAWACFVGSSRVDLQACKLEYSIVSPK